MSAKISCKAFGRRRRRSGLSALEMVLALPILLFLMGYMINFGTVAAWKVRGLTVARTAVWSTRWPRSGGADPRPAYWPGNAAAGTVDLPDSPELDDPRANQPVVRGPLPFGTTVDSELLNPSRGFREGNASLTRDFPLLPRLGPFTLTAKTQLLDNLWQYERTRLSWNIERRIPVIYTLAKAPPEMMAQYIQAYMAIITAPFRNDLAPLDRDDEFIRYGGMFGWGGAPDFHPRLNGFCSLDEELADQQVTNLVERIEGKKETGPDGQVIRRVPSVAETMARAFVNLYQRVAQQLQQMSAPNPPSPAVQAQINQLQQKIDTLNRFISTL